MNRKIIFRESLSEESLPYLTMIFCTVLNYGFNEVCPIELSTAFQEG